MWNRTSRHRRSAAIIASSAVASATLLGHARPAAATNYVWTGTYYATAGDGSFAAGNSSGSNWLALNSGATNAVPGAGDTAVFDDTVASNTTAYTINPDLPATVAVPLANLTVGTIDFGGNIANRGVFTLGGKVPGLTLGTVGTTITLNGSSGGLSRLGGGTNPTVGTQTVISNLVANANQNWAINGPAGEVQVTGTIGNPAGTTIIKSGVGQLEIDADNSQTLLGGYTAQGGTTVVGNSNALGTGTVQVSGTGSGVAANAGLLTNSGIAFANPVNVVQNPNGVTVTLGGAPAQVSSTWAGAVAIAQAVTLAGGTAGTTTFGGVISGAGSVTKADTGTVVLTGRNTYAGPTTVAGGTLLVTGSGTTGAGDVVVTGTGPTALGTLGGTGTAGNLSTGVTSAAGTGVVTVNGYGTITAGASNASTGTLTTGAQSWNSTTGSFVAKVFDTSNTSAGSTKVGNDRLVLSGLTVTPGATPGTGFGVVLQSGGNGTGFTAAARVANDAASTSNPTLAAGSYIVLARDTDLTAADPFASNAALAALNLNFNPGSVPTAGGGDSVVLATLAEPGSDDLIAEDVVAAPEPTSLWLAGVAVAPLVLRRGR